MQVQQLAAYRTKRFYRPESYTALRTALRWRLRSHAGADALMNSQVALDLSAGDSFTDLYGWQRFLAVLEPKLMAIRHGIPLVLLPQTIGPFQSPKAQQLATQVLRGAHQVWARDEQSFELLQQMVGKSATPVQLHKGVDLAFLLEPEAPKELPSEIQHWLSSRDGDGQPIIGINVSGLVYNDPQSAKVQFGLRTDYRQVLVEFLRWCIRSTPAKVILIPHVLTQPGSRESDFDAAKALLDAVPANVAERVSILPPDYTAAELKWLIAQLDWFCGTRMHSTIAALSSGVPTVSLAYSMKTQGVFAQCGLSREVLEMRELDSHVAATELKTAFLTRHVTLDRLASHLPTVREQARQQVNAIVAEVRAHGTLEHIMSQESRRCLPRLVINSRAS